MEELCAKPFLFRIFVTLNLQLVFFLLFMVLIEFHIFTAAFKCLAYFLFLTWRRSVFGAEGFNVFAYLLELLLFQFIRKFGKTESYGCKAQAFSPVSISYAVRLKWGHPNDSKAKRRWKREPITFRTFLEFLRQWFWRCVACGVWTLWNHVM